MEEEGEKNWQEIFKQQLIFREKCSFLKADPGKSWEWVNFLGFVMLYKTYSCTSWLNRLISSQEDSVHDWKRENILPWWNRRVASYLVLALFSFVSFISATWGNENCPKRTGTKIDQWLFLFASPPCCIFNNTLIGISSMSSCFNKIGDSLMMLV